MDAVDFTALFSSPTTRIENKSNFPSSSKTRQYAESHAPRSHNSRDKIVHMTAQDPLSNSTLNSNNDGTEVHQMPQLHNNNNSINNSTESLHQHHQDHEQLQEEEHDEQRKLTRVTQERNSHLPQEEEVVNEQLSVCSESFTDDCSICSSTASTYSMSTFDESTIDTSCPYNNIDKYYEGNNTTTNLKKSKSSSANSENVIQANGNEVNIVEIFDMHKPSLPPCMITEKDRQRELRKLCTTRGDDTVSFRNYIDAILEPDVYKAIFFSLRVTLMVALPLSLIARLDKVASIFPAHVVMPLWGIVDCRFTISEQICAWILTAQLAIFITIFGVIFNACNMVEHDGAWWCAVIFGSFVISLFGDVRCKRLVVLITVIILQMEHMKGGEKLTFPLRVGRDMILATSLALFQSLFPIRYVSTECDDLLARGLLEIIRNMKDATNAFWSHDPVETAQLLTKLTTEPLQNIISILPDKFSFVMYEFWESTLRLELRRERLQLIKMFMPHIHTLQDSARSITLQKSSRSVPYTHHRINKHNYHQHSISHKHTHGHHSRFHHDSNQYTSISNKLESNVENAKYANKDEMADSGHNNFFNIPSSSQLQHQEKEQLQHKQQRLTHHHHNRFRYNDEDKQFWEYVGSFIRPAADYHLKCLEQVMKELGENLNPEEVANNVSFDDLRQSSADLHAVLQKLNFDILIKANRNVDPLLYITTIFFHHLLVRVAFHLIEYGDKMIDFDRRRYKTQWQRFTEFFFLDYWNKFWEDLPLRLTIATSRDVRIYKDAFKLACAYGVGVMFTTYTDPQNIYYFGMAILIAVGWPTAGDTMIASVYRITGMACACSIAYMAIWHTPNLPAQLAVALCGIFIALLFRDQGVYTHTAMYCAMLILPSLNSAGTKLVLLSRIVSNTFTVMAYYAIVVFIFPIDVLKLAKEAQVEALVSVTECFSELVEIISRPFDTASAEEREVIGEAITSVTANCAAVWGKMEHLGLWLPKAAMEPTSHGLPFPIEALRNAFSSMRRLSSAVEIMSLALQILYRSYKMQDLPFNKNNNVDDKESWADSSSDASNSKGNYARGANKNMRTVKTEIHERLRKKYHAGQILSAIAPTMREINRRHWIVMRDFITAMVQPYEFSLERATRHLSSFLELNELLHHTFIEAHAHSIEALRSLYTEQVLHRTMTVAAKQQLLPPQVLSKSFDALTASVMLSQEGCNNMNTNNNNNNNNNNNDDDDDLNNDIGSYGNEFITFARDNNNTHVESEADKLSCHSSVNVEAIAESIANSNSMNINEESGVTNGSIARNIALSFARRHRQQQQRSRQSSIIFVSPKAESTITPTPTTALNQGSIEKINLPDTEHAFPLPLLSKDKVESVQGKYEQHEENSMDEFNVETLPPSPQEIEEVLRGAERQAEQEVYTAYIARRPSTIHTVIKPEEAYDEGVNMSNYILVATDIFFAEAERLMKTMFVINKYARSRIREPKTKGANNNRDCCSNSINVNKKKYKERTFKEINDQ